MVFAALWLSGLAMIECHKNRTCMCFPGGPNCIPDDGGILGSPLTAHMHTLVSSKAMHVVVNFLC